MSALPPTSDIDLLGNREGIIYLDAQVSDSALDLGMAEQELDRTQVSSSAINQRRLGSPQRVRPEQ